MKFHVTFDESKKLLDLKVLNISSFKDALAGLWCDKNFHDALIQWYMPEIDDWVDLDRFQTLFSIQRMVKGKQHYS